VVIGPAMPLALRLAANALPWALGKSRPVDLG